ncbi:MAG: PhoH family protein [Pseudomonadota bacterium]
MSGSAGSQTEFLDFADNRLLAELCGGYDENLARLEARLDVAIAPRGNRLAISGEDFSRGAAIDALKQLYRRLETGLDLEPADIDSAARMAAQGAADGGGGSTSREAPGGSGAGGSGHRQIRTPRRTVTPRSHNQSAYMAALETSDLTFGLGPAGTGKSYIAVAQAVAMLSQRRVERVILSRPAVEAGERIGFLPGDLKDKVDPYLRPLYDALYDLMPGEQVERRIASGDIEIAPLAFMRGRTLSNAFVILDEGQNATPTQMKMFLTRLGEGSRMVVTGDATQSDLPAGQLSGLTDALSVLRGVEGVSRIEFEAEDVVRHPLVARIVGAYEKRTKAKGRLDG